MLSQGATTQYLLMALLGLQLFGSRSLSGQQNLPTPSITEFPAMLEQNIVAGKSAVGTKVRAKLQVATLVKGTVIPRNAVLAGEVIESTAKVGADPSRLAIRMDSVQWKTGSETIKVYLTAWYYPTVAEAGQNLQYEPPQSPSRGWNGQGAYPNPNSPSYKPFPGSDSGGDKNSVPDAAAAKTSDRRLLMKDIDSVREEDGAVALTSKRNLKLDRLTTYVFGEGDLLPRK